MAKGSLEDYSNSVEGQLLCQFEGRGCRLFSLWLCVGVNDKVVDGAVQGHVRDSLNRNERNVGYKIGTSGEISS